MKLRATRGRTWVVLDLEHRPHSCFRNGFRMPRTLTRREFCDTVLDVENSCGPDVAKTTVCRRPAGSVPTRASRTRHVMAISCPPLFSSTSSVVFDARTSLTSVNRFAPVA